MHFWPLILACFLCGRSSQFQFIRCHPDLLQLGKNPRLVNCISDALGCYNLACSLLKASTDCVGKHGQEEFQRNVDLLKSVEGIIVYVGSFHNNYTEDNMEPKVADFSSKDKVDVFQQ